jgi:hypothetical protein
MFQKLADFYCKWFALFYMLGLEFYTAWWRRGLMVMIWICRSFRFCSWEERIYYIVRKEVLFYGIGKYFSWVMSGVVISGILPVPAPGI